MKYEICILVIFIGTTGDAINRVFTLNITYCVKSYYLLLITYYQKVMGKMKKIVALSWLTFFSTVALSAQWANRFAIPFSDINGAAYTPNIALSGGLANPQFSSSDLDDDGDLDLVVFDRVGGVWLPFRNDATAPNTTNYTFMPQWQNRFPQVESWALLRDFNCDGIEDIFCNYRRSSMGYIGIGVFKGSRNIDGSISYTLEKDILFYSDANFPNQDLNIFVSNIDIPAVDDVDGDGDLDILTFNTSGGYVELFRNRSQELGHNCDSLIFALGDNCWGRFYESGISEQINLSPNIDSCANYANWQPVQRNPRHSGSTLATLDMDADGDLELFLGDVSFTNIAMMRNAGSTNIAFVDSQTIFFPDNSVPVDLDAYPGAYFVDVDNDGKKDMLVSPSGDDYSQNVACVWQYQNTGTAAAPVFSFLRDNFLVRDMLDFGGTSAPVFVDFDGDGLRDLVVASNGTFITTTSFRRTLYAFRNVGTTAAPAYRLIDTDFARLSIYNFERMMPTFSDIDADGDQDILLGTIDGTLIQVMNIGTASAPVFAQPSINYKSIDIGSHSAPTFFDFDEDGDLDLLIGERNGNLNYFENIGTTAAADFSNIPTTATFGFIDTRINGLEGNSAPIMLQYQGNWVMLIGTEHGEVLWYDNIRNNLLGTFDLQPNLQPIDEGRQSSIAAADINNDGLLELIVGNKRGGLAAFAYDPLGTSINRQNSTQIGNPKLNIYPNPSANNRIFVSNLSAQTSQAKIYSAQGILVAEFNNLSPQNTPIALDLPADLPNGLYFLQAERQAVQFVLLR
jgi:hypothetical protein